MIGAARFMSAACAAVIFGGLLGVAIAAETAAPPAPVKLYTDRLLRE